MSKSKSFGARLVGVVERHLHPRRPGRRRSRAARRRRRRRPTRSPCRWSGRCRRTTARTPASRCRRSACPGFSSGSWSRRCAQAVGRRGLGPVVGRRLVVTATRQQRGRGRRGSARHGADRAACQRCLAVRRCADRCRSVLRVRASRCTTAWPRPTLDQPAVDRHGDDERDRQRRPARATQNSAVGERGRPSRPATARRKPLSTTSMTRIETVSAASAARTAARTSRPARRTPTKVSR